MALAAVVVLYGQTTGLIAPAQSSDASPTSADGRLASGLLRILGEQPRNLVLSPQVNVQVLRLALAGAGGKTADELRDLFGPDLSPPCPPAAGRDVKGLDEEVWLRLATAAWVQEGVVLTSRFSGEATQRFGAKVCHVDFLHEGPAAIQTINRWSAEATEGKIDKLLQEGSLDPKTRLILTSAIYFKAPWSNSFVPNNTKPLPFRTPGMSPRTVPTMSAVARYLYAEDAAGRYLQIPYSGDRFAMILALPKEDRRPLTLAPALFATIEKWKESPRFESEIVHIHLPRFTISRRSDLTGPLRELGVRDAFDPSRADFRRLVADANDLAISSVTHEAFLSVDEQGTEAAAASGAAFEITSAGGSGTVKDFNADHPFLFAIIDRKTGHILFVGQVFNPVAVECGNDRLKRAHPGAK